MASDEHFMALALAQADAAGCAGEVPVGAVLVKEGRVIASGCNAPVAQSDPTAHAEIMVMRAAAKTLANYRLEGCELFVTLEPCAMCAGAMLHARLKRVVFGAYDNKTGVAGSVLNLFDQPQINHQTAVQGGVLAEACASQLQEFFQGKRQHNLAKSSPLREDALRTPEHRFSDLAEYPWPAHYLSDLPSLKGLRMHYLDEGPPAAAMTYLCLHGSASWSYQFRARIAEFLSAGSRVVAPDLIGFGKSDKPKREAAHSFDWQRQTLVELVERLDLKNLVLVLQESHDWLGLTLPMAAPERYLGQVLLVPATAEPSAAESAALEAPFPDHGHRAALRAFPAIMQEFADSAATAELRQSALRFAAIDNQSRD